MRVFRETRCGKTRKDGHKHTSACYGGPWYIDYIDNEGIRHREVGGYTKNEAHAFLAKVKEDIRLGKYVRKQGQKKFEEFAEGYFAYSKANKKSWERDRSSLCALVPFFKGKTLLEIKPHQIESYKVMRQKYVSETSINRELACLKHMYSMGIKWGEAVSNPVKQVNFFKERLLPMRILSYEEEELLFEACNERLKSIIMIALETGMRRGEILNLKWSQINLQERYIRVEDTKNGEFRIIPISSTLFQTVSRLNRDGDYVFLKPDGNRYLSLRTAFQTAIRKAGIPPIRFHDLRHTFGSRAVMSGVDIVTVKELMGHKSIKMTMRYSHPTPEHKVMAVELLRTNKFGSKTDSKQIYEASNHA